MEQQRAAKLAQRRDLRCAAFLRSRALARHAYAEHERRAWRGCWVMIRPWLHGYLLPASVSRASLCAAPKLNSKRFAHLVEFCDDLRLVVVHLIKQSGVVPYSGLLLRMLVSIGHGEAK